MTRVNTRTAMSSSLQEPSAYDKSTTSGWAGKTDENIKNTTYRCAMLQNLKDCEQRMCLINVIFNVYHVLKIIDDHSGCANRTANREMLRRCLGLWRVMGAISHYSTIIA